MIRIFTLSLLVFGFAQVHGQSWKPAGDRIKSSWATEVDTKKTWPEHPRPQLVRPLWGNLNGLWKYAVTSDDAKTSPSKWDGDILVPFPIESSLSGVGKEVGPDKRLWYFTTFGVPQQWEGQRLILNFGAVDWDTVVWVNGREVGRHRGGYDPFSMDITDALKKEGVQELRLSVWDPADAGFQPRGKQVREPKGIWYTSVTGIWQTVWMEPVPKTSIQSLKLVPDIDSSTLRISASLTNPSSDLQIRVAASDGESTAATGKGAAGRPLDLKIDNAKLWSPDEPFLYGLEVELVNGDGKVLDTVSSYFGMRKIAVAKDKDGFNRLFLNNEPLFQFGPLDQGWWPDGLYLAPTDEALQHDILVTKQLGFNMARKHVKVEPARWYYHCDRLGLLVWQDMPSGDKYIGKNDPDFSRSVESEKNFRREYKAMIDFLHNHPSIVAWVPFNEGWGQFKTDDILAWTKNYDSTRLVDGPSGWADRGTGDMNDMHSYPGPAMPKPEEKRAVVLGEFGGLGWPVEEHLWWNKRNWGYRTYKSREELVTNYEKLIDKLLPLIGKGLAAAVYTQTTDVEGEVNGLMTYDREVLKFPFDRIAPVNLRVYEPPKVYDTVTVLADSSEEPQTWRFTTSDPGEGWALKGFDDSKWETGRGGFGTKDTPGAVVGTTWETNDIWIRRSFELTGAEFENLHFRVHHDEDAKVYINGLEVATFEGYTTGYEDRRASVAAAKMLRVGKNTIAVHCHQTSGGQMIDVGLVDLRERTPDKKPE